jgi:hypothetical protein
LNGEKSFALGVALNILKLRFRDPVRFKVTALTGKTDPADFKEADFLLAEAFDKLAAGENPEKVQRDAVEKLMGCNDERKRIEEAEVEYLEKKFRRVGDSWA